MGRSVEISICIKIKVMGFRGPYEKMELWCHMIVVHAENEDLGLNEGRGGIV